MRKRGMFDAITGVVSAVDEDVPTGEALNSAADIDSRTGAIAPGLSIDYGTNRSRSQCRSPVSHRAIKMGTPTPNGTLSAIVDGVPVKFVIEAPTK